MSTSAQAKTALTHSRVSLTYAIQKAPIPFMVGQTNAQLFLIVANNSQHPVTINHIQGFIPTGTLPGQLCRSDQAAGIKIKANDTNTWQVAMSSPNSESVDFNLRSPSGAAILENSSYFFTISGIQVNDQPGIASISIIESSTSGTFTTPLHVAKYPKHSTFGSELELFTSGKQTAIQLGQPLQFNWQGGAKKNTFTFQYTDGTTIFTKTKHSNAVALTTPDTYPNPALPDFPLYMGNAQTYTISQSNGGTTISQKQLTLLGLPPTPVIHTFTTTPHFFENTDGKQATVNLEWDIDKSKLTAPASFTLTPPADSHENTTPINTHLPAKGSAQVTFDQGHTITLEAETTYNIKAQKSLTVYGISYQFVKWPFLQTVYNHTGQTALTSDGKYLLRSGSSKTVVDLKNNTYMFSPAFAHLSTFGGLVCTKDNRYALVTTPSTIGGQSLLQVLDIQGDPADWSIVSDVATIKLPGLCSALALSPDGNTVYAVYSNNADLTAISLKKAPSQWASSSVATLSSKNNTGIAITPDGGEFLVITADKELIVTGPDGTVKSSKPLPQLGVAETITVSPNGRYAFVSDTILIKSDTGWAPDTAKLGSAKFSAMPIGMALVADGSSAYICHIDGAWGKLSFTPFLDTAA